MMRLDAMLNRLPPVYDIRPGALLNDFLAVFALALTAFDEDMDRVQRSHWVDTALDLEDLTRIGALFGVTPAGWEGLELYRERLKAMIAGRLKGAVTADVIEYVLLRILLGVRAELGDEYIDLPTTVELGDRILERSVLASQSRGSFIEFPPRGMRSAELAGAGALRQPLARMSLVNKGMEPTALLGRIRGVQGLKTAVPTLVNLTTGAILLYADLLECGQMLELGVDGAGRLTGWVGDRNVSDKLWTGEGFAPGARFAPVRPDPEPRPIFLARGANDLWFFPLALYDARGLGSAVFANPQPDLAQGRFGGSATGDGTRYDRSLFHQDHAVSLDLWWEERAPAAFRVDIPAGVVLRPQSRPGRDAETERAQLFALLQDTVDDLRAAGVDGRVAPLPLREEQRLASRAVVMHPKYTAETQRLESALSGLSALFDLTAIDGARFE
jgi:hypothetical protein